MSAINWVDVAIIAIIALSFAFGLWRGLLKEVLSLVTWVVALIVARVYSVDLAPFLLGIFEGETTRYVAAFTAIFVATMISGTLINHFMTKLWNLAGLKLTDRLLGGVFGVARGGIIVMLVIFLFSSFLSNTLVWQESRLIPYGVSMLVWSKILISDVSVVNLTT